MKLSDAIRIQAEPQGRFNLRNSDGHTDAMGGALQSVGRLDDYLKHGGGEDCVVFSDEQRQVLRELGWLELLSVAVDCPACSTYPQRLYGRITHLNDKHEWSRDQIADFVQTVEAAPVKVDEKLKV